MVRWREFCSLFFMATNVAGYESQATTDATTSTTGSIFSAGGLGIQRNMNVGGTLAVEGAATFAGNLACR
jgi:hypothetical protein